ncbi:MAG: N-ethylammeline chlorohydrolase [SAR86 cluster bacterium]|uniref:5-methylthioadenosine/S-adenosylhomocysteine deaminase n=1 Tax=SAR86 cluster bacterium TaxID=2030880 RepID=A0A2A5BAM2_9GAMM|nr:MAG: N-ethylammeline chlorohydrolase [SAR86 cluster bacterium]
MNADLLIHAKWIIPVAPQGAVLEDHCIAIRDKKIVAICPSDVGSETISAQQITRLGSHALIPGLVNAHGHAAMSLFRGIADDIPLEQWLEKKIWPLESKFVSESFVQQGTTLAIAEMIRSGTTCFADMYFYPDIVAKSVIEARLRAQLASPVLDFPTVWAQDADEYISKATNLHDDYRHSELVYTAFGPHAPYTVSDAPLQKLSMLAEELGIPVHMHVHETAQEVADAIKNDGRRPLQRLADLGLINPGLVCVHATQLNSTEMKLLAEHGAHVVHCPESNMKLASGFCEVSELLEHGVNVALGTDGCASNNDLDMFSEMRTAALLAKVVADNASALPAQQALEMATINGAKALGMEELIGTLEPGKFADITAVNLDSLNSMPVYNPLSQLVYSTQASQVSHVWCGGELLLLEGELQTLDRDLIKVTSYEWQQQLEAAQKA